MFRIEVFLAVLFTGLLLSELVEQVVLRLLTMALPSAGVELQAAAAAILFLLVLLVIYCINRPRLAALPPLQYLEREFNFFRKKVVVVWPEDWCADTTKTVTFTFDHLERDELAMQVLRQGEVVHVTEVWSSSTLEVIFPASTAGAYTFLLTSSGRPVRGAPWTRTVVPAAVEPRLVRPVELGAQTAVVPAGGGFAVRVQLRDAWENHVEATEEHCDQLQVIVDSDAFYEIGVTSSLPRYIKVQFSFTNSTCDAFPTSLHYGDRCVARLQLLVLTPAKLDTVNSYVARMGWNSYFEVQLTRLHGVQQKAKTVYVYLTDRQVTIREFYLRLIPHKLATYRVAPTVSFNIQVSGGGGGLVLSRKAHR